MRRFLLVAIIIAILVGLVGCNIGLFSRQISPPPWILGTWADAFGINEWTFTEDNAVFSAVIVSIDFKELGNTFGVSVTDTSTATEYALILRGGGSEAGAYSFEKETDATLSYTVTTAGLSFPSLLLTRE